MQRFPSVKYDVGSPGLRAMQHYVSQSGHPNLAGGKFVLRRDKIRESFNRGELLRDRISSLDDLKRGLGHIWCAVRALHASGYAHGDISPDNMVVVEDEKGNWVAKLKSYAHVVPLSMMVDTSSGREYYRTASLANVDSRLLDLRALYKSATDLAMDLADKGAISMGELMAISEQLGGGRGRAEDYVRRFDKVFPYEDCVMVVGEPELEIMADKARDSKLVDGLLAAVRDAIDDDFTEEMLQWGCSGSQGSKGRHECVMAALDEIANTRNTMRIRRAMNELKRWSDQFRVRDKSDPRSRNSQIPQAVDSIFTYLRKRGGIPAWNAAFPDVVALLGVMTADDADEARDFLKQFKLTLSAGRVPESFRVFPKGPRNPAGLEHEGIEGPVYKDGNTGYYYYTGLYDEPVNFKNAFEGFLHLDSVGYDHSLSDVVGVDGQAKLMLGAAAKMYPTPLEERLERFVKRAITNPREREAALAAARAGDLRQLEEIFERDEAYVREATRKRKRDDSEAKHEEKWPKDASDYYAPSQLAPSQLAQEFAPPSEIPSYLLQRFTRAPQPY